MSLTRSGTLVVIDPVRLQAGVSTCPVKRYTDLNLEPQRPSNAYPAKSTVNTSNSSPSNQKTLSA
jgi:hypothetical protein